MFTAVVASGIVAGALSSFIVTQKSRRQPVSPWLSAGRLLACMAFGAACLDAWQKLH